MPRVIAGANRGGQRQAVGNDTHAHEPVHLVVVAAVLDLDARAPQGVGIVGPVVAQRIDGKCRLNRLRSDELDERFPGLLAAVLQAREA